MKKHSKHATQINVKKRLRPQSTRIDDPRRSNTTGWQSHLQKTRKPSMSSKRIDSEVWETRTTSSGIPLNKWLQNSQHSCRNNLVGQQMPFWTHVYASAITTMAQQRRRSILIDDYEDNNNEDTAEKCSTNLMKLCNNCRKFFFTNCTDLLLFLLLLLLRLWPTTTAQMAPMTTTTKIPSLTTMTTTTTKTQQWIVLLIRLNCVMIVLNSSY